MNIVQKNCIKLDEKSANLQNDIYVLLIARRKSQFITKNRTIDYNWLIEKGRDE
jgi:hypothetical protein